MLQATRYVADATRIYIIPSLVGQGLAPAEKHIDFTTVKILNKL